MHQPKLAADLKTFFSSLGFDKLVRQDADSDEELANTAGDLKGKAKEAASVPDVPVTNGRPVSSSGWVCLFLFASPKMYADCQCIAN